MRGTVGERIEALGDQHRDRQPAPLEGAEHVADRGEGAFDDHALRRVGRRALGEPGRELHRDRAAERVAEDVARAGRAVLGEPAPGGARRPRRRRFPTAARRCCCRSRGSRPRAPRSRARASARCGRRCGRGRAGRRAGRAAAAPAGRRCRPRARAGGSAGRSIGETCSIQTLSMPLGAGRLLELGRRRRGRARRLEDPLALLRLEAGAADRQRRRRRRTAAAARPRRRLGSARNKSRVPLATVSLSSIARLSFDCATRRNPVKRGSRRAPATS